MTPPAQNTTGVLRARICAEAVVNKQLGALKMAVGAGAPLSYSCFLIADGDGSLDIS